MEMLTVREAAQKLKLGRSTVYALIARNRLPVLRVGRAVRIPADRLEAWIAARIEDPAEPER